MRAVIDTNVLVSALLTPHGVPAQLVAAIHRQALTPIISASILLEYAEVLKRPRFGFAHDRLGQLLADMQGLSICLKPGPIETLNLPDPDDAPFIAAALAAASPIVTGNSKHYPAQTGVIVLSPSQALARIQAG